MTLPVASRNATARGARRKAPCTAADRSSTAVAAGTPWMPTRRPRNEPATARGPPGGYDRRAGTLPGVMAKAKRRKLRARRKKANHGRRPNAGRG